MLRNDDRIARPARGRFFPVSVLETVRLIRTLGFATLTYRKRLDITFRNAEPTSAHGIDVAALYPADEIIVYSFPDDFDRARAKALLEKALQEFALLAKDSPPTNRRQTAVSFRAYFGTPARLTITRRRRRATLATYRGDAKFSHAFKPKGVKTDERVVQSVAVT
jgi:hypothetical protein